MLSVIEYGYIEHVPVCVLIGFITDFMNMYFKPIVMAVGQLPELAERLRNLLGTCDPQSCLVEDG